MDAAGNFYNISGEQIFYFRGPAVTLRFRNQKPRPNGALCWIAFPLEEGNKTINIQLRYKFLQLVHGQGTHWKCGFRSMRALKNAQRLSRKRQGANTGNCIEIEQDRERRSAASGMGDYDNKRADDRDAVINSRSQRIIILPGAGVSSSIPFCARRLRGDRKDEGL